MPLPDAEFAEYRLEADGPKTQYAEWLFLSALGQYVWNPDQTETLAISIPKLEQGLPFKGLFAWPSHGLNSVSMHKSVLNLGRLAPANSSQAEKKKHAL